jgi:multidrug efflux pump subunit AcrA (membrane-fusion protein)
MFTDISLNSRRQTPVLTVPETAIFYNIYGEAVYVLEKSGLEKPSSSESDPEPDSRLAARQVDVLYRRAGTAGVQSGLANGDLVVTSGQLKLYPSLRVVIVDDVPEYQSNSQ